MNQTGTLSTDKPRHARRKALLCTTVVEAGMVDATRNPDGHEQFKLLGEGESLEELAFCQRANAWA
jgi:hypothetical protein